MENETITKEVILQDISETQKEIDDFNDEKSVLMRNPQDNKVRIYLLEGRVSERQTFINKLNSLPQMKNDK